VAFIGNPERCLASAPPRWVSRRADFIFGIDPRVRHLAMEMDCRVKPGMARGERMPPRSKDGRRRFRTRLSAPHEPP
jgi:hypothetical protein